jgi:hypothetical protein
VDAADERVDTADERVNAADERVERADESADEDAVDADEYVANPYGSIATTIVTKKDGRHFLKSWHDISPSSVYRPAVENYSLESQLYNNPFNSYEGGECGCGKSDDDSSDEENITISSDGIMQFVLPL